MELADLEVIEQYDSDSSIHATGSPASISSISSSTQLSNDAESEKDSAVVAFMRKMQENLTKYTKSLLERSRPSRYKKMGKQAARTERQHRQIIRQETATLRAAGFGDIRKFFTKIPQTSTDNSTTNPTQINEAFEEEEEEGEQDIIEIEGISLREEEEESEEELRPVGRQSGHSESMFPSLHPELENSPSTSVAAASNVSPETNYSGMGEFENDMETILVTIDDEETTELMEGSAQAASGKSRECATPPAPESHVYKKLLKFFKSG